MFFFENDDDVLFFIINVYKFLSFVCHYFFHLQKMINIVKFSAVELLLLNFNHFDVTFITICLLRIFYITKLVRFYALWFQI